MKTHSHTVVMKKRQNFQVNEELKSQRHKDKNFTVKRNITETASFYRCGSYTASP